MSDLMQGLSISLIGLLITFFALGAFIVLMVILKRIFPSKPAADEEELGLEPVVQIELDQVSAVEEDAEIAAAIAAAVAYVQTANQSSLGANLEGGRGHWWAANQPAAVRSAGWRRK